MQQPSAIISKIWVSIDKHVTREELSPIEVLVTPCVE